MTLLPICLQLHFVPHKYSQFSLMLVGFFGPSNKDTVELTADYFTDGLRRSLEIQMFMLVKLNPHTSALLSPANRMLF